MLLAVGLWTGVPEVASGSKLDELVKAVGSVGVGVGLSFACFLVGSFSDDVIRQALGVRGARALTRFSGAPPVLTVRRMEEWGIRSELERLEASIDRAYAEVLLRYGLIPPAAVATAAGFSARWPYGAASVAVLLALVYQGVSRRSELRADLSASQELRLSVAAQLEAEPETQAFMEQQERLRAEEAAEASRANTRAARLREEQAAKTQARVEEGLAARVAELEKAEGTASELEKKELDLLRKWREARRIGMQLSSEDAAALREIAEIRARELARQFADEAEDAS